MEPPPPQNHFPVQIPLQPRLKVIHKVAIESDFPWNLTVSIKDKETCLKSWLRGGHFFRGKETQYSIFQSTWQKKIIFSTLTFHAWPSIFIEATSSLSATIFIILTVQRWLRWKRVIQSMRIHWKWLGPARTIFNLTTFWEILQNGVLYFNGWWRSEGIGSALS